MRRGEVNGIGVLERGEREKIASRKHESNRAPMASEVVDTAEARLRNGRVAMLLREVSWACLFLSCLIGCR